MTTYKVGYFVGSPEIFPGDGVVTDDATRAFLTTFMAEFRDHIVRVLTVLPRRPDVAEAR